MATPASGPRKRIERRRRHQIKVSVRPPKFSEVSVFFGISDDRNFKNVGERHRNKIVRDAGGFEAEAVELAQGVEQ